MKVKTLFFFAAMSGVALISAACDDDSSSNNNNGTCGNGTLDPGEDCDGDIIPETATCAILVSGTDGTVSCTAECTIDTSACTEPECGNGIMEAGEECDQDDFGGNTCEDEGFGGGTLGCTTDCQLVTTECTELCINEMWEDCNTAGGTTECCGANGFAGTCDSLYEMCLQTCDEGGDCGWGLQCIDNSYMPGECFYQFCGHGDMAGFIGTPSDVNAACDLGDGRTGYCVPLWRQIDDTGLCQEVGTLANNAACVSDDDVMIDGDTTITADSQCQGRCLTPRDDAGNQTSENGNCFDYCDPNDSLAGEDTCPTDWNCLSLGSIDLEPTIDGSENSNVLFREADQGLCVPMVAEANAIIDEPIVMCDLITGLQIKNGTSPCAEGETCQLNGFGNLLGVCAPSTEADAIDAVCDSESDEETCSAGSFCYIRNFMALDMYDALINDSDPGTLDWACVKVCDASAAEPDCGGLMTDDATPVAYECVSASRIFTQNHEQHSYSYTVNGTVYTDTEESESALGLCVPPAPQAK
ncbi:MAG: hypothetical protein JXR95_05145 [Deltaproteobacteria bacterium]|nr:hypothetical protein [Deltaproteobacteria bacterium]